MGYVELKKFFLRRKKQAVKLGLDKWLLDYFDRVVVSSDIRWGKSKCKGLEKSLRDMFYARATNDILKCNEIITFYFKSASGPKIRFL